MKILEFVTDPAAQTSRAVQYLARLGAGPDRCSELPETMNEPERQSARAPETALQIPEQGLTRRRRIAVMLALVIAGEAVYVLPFVLARVFRPTLLDVLGLTNLELGLAFSAYGVVAMLAYLVGGPLADRFSARRLMTVAVLATAAGGLVLARLPSLPGLRWLYAGWGLTTVLLFWAPLIRATRTWGGERAQGRAYGLLDGGRGLFAGLLASAAVAVFAGLLPEDVQRATLAEREAAFIAVLWMATGVTAAAGLLVWICLPEQVLKKRSATGARTSGIRRLRRVMKMPAVWLQALIVGCAYVGYKSTDDFSLYARDAFGYDDLAAAKIGALALWVRPLAAVSMGLIADRLSASRATALSFAIMSLGALTIALAAPQPGLSWMLAALVVTTSVGVCALRGTYFALFAEARVPWAYTGGAVGLVSFVGYTPEVFMGPLMGVLLDRSPGVLGHQHVFALVAASGAVGLVLTLAFRRITRRGPIRENTHSP